jgi:hypothetical protein
MGVLGVEIKKLKLLLFVVVVVFMTRGVFYVFSID